MVKIPLFGLSDSLVDRKKGNYYIIILHHLYETGSSSIAELSKKLHTSVPSVTTFLNELIAIGWVIEEGAGKTKSGRRPVFYNLNSSHKNTLVIDVNIFKTRLLLSDLRNNLTELISIEKDIDDPDFTPYLIRSIKELIGGLNNTWAIGLCLPGLVDKKSGIDHTHQSLNLNSLSLAKNLENLFKIPAFTIHDSKASLMGEYMWGLAKNKQDVLLINIDWGVGLGIMLNGTIVEGSQGFAGELGHIQIDPAGELCKCGKIGCLETVSSASTLIKRAQKGLEEGKVSVLSLSKKPISLESVINAANKGDEFSIDLLFDIGRELGKGLSIAVHLFNPEVIIIDGILTNAGDMIISTLKQSINKYCLNEYKQNLEIITSPLGENAKVFGTNTMVFNKMTEYHDN